MKRVTKAAKLSSIRSQMCRICSVRKNGPCPSHILLICHDAYVEGFKKGVKAAEKAIKESNNPNVLPDSGRRS